MDDPNTIPLISVYGYAASFPSNFSSGSWRLLLKHRLAHTTLLLQTFSVSPLPVKWSPRVWTWHSMSFTIWSPLMLPQPPLPTHPHTLCLKSHGSACGFANKPGAFVFLCFCIYAPASAWNGLPFCSKGLGYNAICSVNLWSFRSLTILPCRCLTYFANT